MTHVSPPASQHHSRLIRFLSDLAVADVDVSHRDFAERLGLLLNFSDSIILADALKAQRWVAVERDGAEVGRVKAEFLRVQSVLVAAIVSACAGDTSARIRWPVIANAASPLSFDPYLRFYTAHQRDLDIGVRGLRSMVRETMSGIAAGLAQLVALDIALEDTLWDDSRRFLAVVPRFLEKRFGDLLGGAGSAAAFSQFARETQGLLLAELELRLQPVLGLIEALEKEANSHS